MTSSLQTPAPSGVQAPAFATAPPTPSAAGQRYVDGLTRLHGRLRYGGLVDAIEGSPLVRLDGLGDGLTTVGFRTSQLPERYLRGLYGFRLAEFLQTGLIDADLALSRGLAHEPIGVDVGPETVHLCTLDEAGAIVGYVCLAPAPDADPRALDDPERAPFPVESAHEVDVLAPFAAPGRTTHDVYEIKRLVRKRAMARGLQRSRVPWHLIVGLSRTALAMGSGLQVTVGDSGERGALRHLVWLGFDLKVTEGTRPRVGRHQLMWPSYELSDDLRAKPFAAEIVPETLAAHTDVVESALRDYDGEDWAAYTVGKLAELIQRRQQQERLAA